MNNSNMKEAVLSFEFRVSSEKYIPQPEEGNITDDISMPVTLPPKAANIFVWHQGALGDVLLAGPALQAVAGHYPGARLTLTGGPGPLGLLAASLPVAAVWDSQRAIWLELFQNGGDITGPLQSLVAGFELALVFAPAAQPEFLDRLQRAGIPIVVWLPSFPVQARAPIRELQAERLQAAGLSMAVQPFRLTVPEADLREARAWLQTLGGAETPLVALAPGSGHVRKNWPLASYAHLAQYLTEQYQAQVWWVLGPAEAGLERELQEKHPHQARRLLNNLSLGQLAARLSEFHLYVGNDSGVTHLAAALGGPAVVAIFGPSDPVIWGPPGERTIVVAADQPCAPCTRGREIGCPDPVCLSCLSPETIMTAVNRVFSV